MLQECKTRAENNSLGTLSHAVADLEGIDDALGLSSIINPTMKSYIISIAALLCASCALMAQTPVGAYFSFQNAASQSAANGEGTYSTAVSVENFTGTPTFTGTGLIGGGLGSFASSFTAYNSSVWTGARGLGWNAKTAAASRTFQVTLSTTGVENLAARFNYRLNGVTTNGGQSVTALAAFEYRIGSGAWTSVPGASLTLVNSNSYNSVWTANLNTLSALNNQPEITLRWSFPAFDLTTTDRYSNLDNLQVTGSSFALSRPRVLPVGNYNVLFVAFDDLKPNFGPFMTPDPAAAMPKAVTPHLDSLSSTGMAFTRAYCQQAVCWASRTSLLTGCRPDTTKIWDDGPNYRTTMPGIISLPQHFANLGYSVAGYGKIFDPRSTPANNDAALSWPDGQADRSASRTYFEDGKWQVERDTGSRNGFATDIAVTNFWVTPNRPVNPNTDYSDGLIATDAINKLNTFATSYTNTGTPFFLAVGFKKPHLPFNAPKNFWDLYDPAQINLTGYTGTRTFPTGTLSFTGANFEITAYGDVTDNTINDPAFARQMIHGYLAATSFADYQLGRVLAALNANPTVAANTIIVALGDHGWHLGDHNGFWSKHSCYEQAARAPLIIRTPGMNTIATAGKPCDTPVEFVDIYPTLVDLASQAIPAQPAGLEMQGQSLRPLLEDPEQPWKKGAFTQYQRFIQGTGITNGGNGMGYSIRTKRFRYTEWWRTESTVDSEGNSLNRDVKIASLTTPRFVELYDILNDPKETVNQANNPAYATHRAELAAALAGGNGWDAQSVAPPAEFPTTFSTWQSSHVEPGYPLGQFADAMDPDGDGLINLREYAHGTNPLSPSAEPTWSEVTGTPGARFLSLVFPLVGSRTDVTTAAKTSSTLSNWTTTGVTNATIGQAANRTWRRSSIPMSGAPPAKGFLRLEFQK
jgi:iduronate 2-sulfatase